MSPVTEGTDFEVWEWDEWPADTLVLVACSTQKNPSKCSMIPELRYTSSCFRMAIKAARALNEDRFIRILSAHYGFISLTRMTKPYDVRIGDKQGVSAEAIADQAKFLPEHSAVVSLMPHDYTAASRLAFPDLIDAMHDVRGIGDIRHRLGLIAQLRDDSPRVAAAS